MDNTVLIGISQQVVMHCQPGLSLEPDTGSVRAVTLTKASGSEASDATVGAGLVINDTGPLVEDKDVAVLSDPAYATGDMHCVLNGKKWVPVLKPWPLSPAVEGGLTFDGFVYDTVTGTLT